MYVEAVRWQRSAASRDVLADYDEQAVTVAPRKREAAGVRAVMVSLQRGMQQMGALRTAAALARLNQRNGFDCPGCAWPEEPGGRKLAEFCENGAKAVAEEATKRTVTAEFFARHSVAELSAKPEYWLSQQGRLAHPMVLRPGDDHYRPISWDAAYQLIAEQLNGLDSPDRAVFYTSGRTSNEAAFCYQLLVRSFGTNNLPDCSNMCHESSGAALTDSIGIGKGSVTIGDVEHADLIVIAGQNPGTNHPRMLSVLGKAKANGAKIIAVNPLPEAGLIRFKDPQKVNGVVGHGIPIADEFVQIRLGRGHGIVRRVRQVVVGGRGEGPRQRCRPVVRRQPLCRIRRVPPPDSAGRLGHRDGRHRHRTRATSAGRRDVDGVAAHGHLLGYGLDPTRPRRGHHR